MEKEQLSFGRRYMEAVQIAEDIILFECIPFIKENHNKIKDWSKLNISILSIDGYYRYGPGIQVEVDILKEIFNKDRHKINSFIVSILEKDTMVKVIINGNEHFLMSDEIVRVADYIQQQLCK